MQEGLDKEGFEICRPVEIRKGNVPLAIHGLSHSRYLPILAATYLTFFGMPHTSCQRGKRQMDKGIA
jgi:hypothetical protein